MAGHPPAFFSRPCFLERHQGLATGQRAAGKYNALTKLATSWMGTTCTRARTAFSEPGFSCPTSSQTFSVTTSMLYTEKPKRHTMIHTLGRLILFIVNTLELATFTLGMKVLAHVRRLHHSPAYFTLFRFWCRSFVRALGVDLRLHQNNARTLPERYILIANHPSAFEDIGIPALFPVHSVAKVQVNDWWLVGRLTAAAGSLYVDRDDADSRRALIDKMIAALDDGKNIALYPEGGCTGRRITHDFKLGAFDVSLQTGIPIVPVFIHYESQQDFEWQEPHTLLDKLWHFIRTQNHHANYYVFDAIDPADFDDKIAYAKSVQKKYLLWQEKYLQ
jgi:1-acyl-sn-glycerol-3-phosphate acyltransferase